MPPHPTPRYSAAEVVEVVDDSKHEVHIWIKVLTSLPMLRLEQDWLKVLAKGESL